MSDEALWADLRPILQDLTARIGRIEQFLAPSGLQVGSGTSDAMPGSFNPPPTFATPAPIGGPAAAGSPGPAPGSGLVPDYLLVMARSGKKIQAISELRKVTGMSLKDAKAVIDQALRGYY